MNSEKHKTEQIKGFALKLSEKIQRFNLNNHHQSPETINALKPQNF
jgi:hypothetical protein